MAVSKIRCAPCPKFHWQVKIFTASHLSELKEYSEISGWFKHPILWYLLIDTHLKSLCSKLQCLWFYVGEICGITWILLLHWILCYNYWCPKNAKICLFCQNWPVSAVKSSWGEVRIGEFFLNNNKKNPRKTVCVWEKYTSDQGSLNVFLRFLWQAHQRVVGTALF